MDHRTKAEKFWDRAAKSYDKEEKKDEKASLRIIESTKKYLKNTDTVLDFGCGTGLVSNEIAKQVKFIHAIDLSSQMVEHAQAKAKARGILNIDYRHSTISDESWKRDTFEIIFAFHILHLVEDTQAVIQRLNALLKPGGLIISLTPCMGEKPIMNGFLSILSRVGIVPKMNSFKEPHLIQYLTAANFDLIESEKIANTSNQYLIVARKKS